MADYTSVCVRISSPFDGQNHPLTDGLITFIQQPRWILGQPTSHYLNYSLMDILEKKKRLDGKILKGNVLQLNIPFSPIPKILFTLSDQSLEIHVPIWNCCGHLHLKHMYSVIYRIFTKTNTANLLNLTNFNTLIKSLNSALFHYSTMTANIFKNIVGFWLHEARTV